MDPSRDSEGEESPRFEKGVIFWWHKANGCIPSSFGAPMVFTVFSRDSWGLSPVNTHYIGLIQGFPIRVRW